MRPSNKSRSRNKSSNHGGQRRMGNIVNRVFDSAGPDGKVRGTPQQIIDKYNVLARDAQVSGDRVAAESYLQHAEHYSRLLGEAQRQQQEQRQNQDRETQERDENQGAEPSQDTGRPRSEPASMSSGMTMIDVQDGDDSSGPVDTPESRRRTEAAAAQAPASNTTGNGAEHAQQEPAPSTEPAKRSRPRRRAKAETNGEAAAAAE